MNVWHRFVAAARRASVGGVCVWLMAVAAARAQNGDVAVWRGAFEDALTRIVTEQKVRLQAIPDAYASGLVSLADVKQRNGDLDGLLQVRSEIDRFAKDRSVPLTSPVGVQADIMLLQEQFRQRFTEAQAEKAQRILALVDQYTQRLDAQVTRLAKAGDIPAALAYRAEMTRVHTVPEVAAAEFERAASTPPPRVAPAGPCPACRGGGKAQIACDACKGSSNCAACNGTGKRPGLGTSQIMCVTCRGSGQCKVCCGSGMGATEETCPSCGGAGQVPTLNTLKTLYDTPEKFEGTTVSVRARVVRASLLSTVTASSVGTVSLALRDSETGAATKAVLAREVPVASPSVAARIAALFSEAKDRAIGQLLIRVDAGRAPVIVGAYAP